MVNTTLQNLTSNKPKEVGKPVVLDTYENLVEKDIMGVMEDEHPLDNQPGTSNIPEIFTKAFEDPQKSGSISFTLEKAADTAEAVMEKVASIATEGFVEMKDLFKNVFTYGPEASKQNNPAQQEEDKKQADYQRDYQIRASLSEAMQKAAMQTNEYLIENVLRGNENVISKEEVRASVNYNVTDTRTLDKRISEADARLLVEIRKQQIMASKKAEQQQEDAEVANKPVVQMNTMEGGTAGGQANIQAVATAG